MKIPLIAAFLSLFSFCLYAVTKKKPDVDELVANALPKIQKPSKKYKILCFSKTYGFYHTSIPTGEAMLRVMGEKTGLFEVTFSHDLSNFLPENITKFDAICFNNNTHIHRGLKDPALRKSLIDYVKNGGGIFAIHAATDGGWDEYTEMIGGNFDGHPWGARGTWSIYNEDPTHPIVKNVHNGQQSFMLRDELYQYKDLNRSKSRVLLAVDNTHPTNQEKKGKRSDNDYPLTWVKDFGKGRVFVSALGHNKEIFYNPEILQMWTEGFRWILREIDVPTKSLPKPTHKPSQLTPK